MIGINRELSNISEEYVYTVIDSIDVDVEKKTEYATQNINNNYYLVNSRDRKFLFRGTKGERISNYVGFETSDNELTNYNRDLKAIFDSHLDFNYALRVDTSVHTRF